MRWVDVLPLPTQTHDSRLVTFNRYGGDLDSTREGSQSGMPGSCWPVKQTGCNLTADNFEYALAA